MRIGIDARLWGEEENRGLGRYVKELILHLEKISLKEGFFIFLRKNNFNAYQPTNPHFHKIIWDAPWYTLQEQINFQPLLKAKLDLMHFPHWNVPYFYNHPFVVTIHDLILLESNRQRHATTLGKTRYALKFAGFKTILKHALFKSKKIITISETTKKSIVQHFSNLPPAKIEVIYEGASELNSKTIKETLDIAKPYLLYVGSAYPHKNLKFLLNSFIEFNADAENKYKLVLVGRQDFFYQRLKKEASQSATLQKAMETGQIVFLSQTTDQELSALYQNAAFFISPSLLEGFGLPPLEAALLDTPSILSDISAFREVMGDLAIYFDPHNADDFKTKLQLALNDSELHDKILKTRNELKQKFNWLNCAQSTLDIYRQFLS